MTSIADKHLSRRTVLLGLAALPVAVARKPRPPTPLYPSAALYPATDLYPRG